MTQREKAEALLDPHRAGWAMRATMGLVARIAHELRDSGTYEALGRDYYDSAQVSALFAAR